MSERNWDKLLKASQEMKQQGAGENEAPIAPEARLQTGTSMRRDHVSKGDQGNREVLDKIQNDGETTPQQRIARLLARSKSLERQGSRHDQTSYDQLEGINDDRKLAGLKPYLGIDEFLADNKK